MFSVYRAVQKPARRIERGGFNDPRQPRPYIMTRVAGPFETEDEARREQIALIQKSALSFEGLVFSIRVDQGETFEETF